MNNPDAPLASVPLADCELCRQTGGRRLGQAGACRVVLVEDARFPGFCRVIHDAHVREMTDLPAVARQAVMATVFAVEQAVRTVCKPDKINLASFGNVVPHLHWHIIPRWQVDSHFPEPLWGTVQRPVPAHLSGFATTLSPPDWPGLAARLCQALLAGEANRGTDGPGFVADPAVLQGSG